MSTTATSNKHHPFDRITTLTQLKDSLNGLFFYEDVALYTGIITAKNTHLESIDNKKEYFNRTLDLSFEALTYTKDIYIHSEEDIPKIKGAISPSHRYLILYYFKEPFESLECKIEYMKSLTKIEHPKKYIFDLLHNKRITGNNDLTLNFLERYLLGFGYSKRTYFEHQLKPLLSKNFTKSGLDYLKSFYDKLSIQDEISIEKINNPEMSCFYTLLENIDLLYNNPDIKDYESLIAFKKQLNQDYLKQLVQKIEETTAIFTQFNKDNNITIASLKTYISEHEAKNYDQLLKEDTATYEFLGKCNSEQAEEYKKDVERLSLLEKSSNAYLKSYYYHILLTHLSNEKNVFLVANDLSNTTIDKNIAKLFNPFLDSELMNRNISLIIESHEKSLNNRAYYDNNIFNESFLSGIAVKTIKGPVKNQALNTYELIQEKEKELKGLNKTIESPSCTYEEKAEAKKNSKEILSTIDKLKEELAIQNIIIINGDAKKITTYGNDSDVKINIPNNSIDLVIKDSFRRCYPINFTVSTVKQKKAFEAPYDISFLTPDNGGMAEKFSAFIFLILRELSNVKENKVIYPITKLASELKYGSSQDALKKLRTNLNVFCTILKKTEYKSVYLKGSKRGSVANFSLISSYSINTQSNELILCFDAVVKEITKNNTSKSWLNDICLNSGAIPILIIGKTNSLMNQDSKQDYIVKGDKVEYKNSKNFSLNTFAKNIPSIANIINQNDSEHIDKCAKLLHDSFQIINENEGAPFFFTGLTGISNSRTVNDLKNRKINVKYKNKNIPYKMQHRAKFKTEHLKNGSYNSHAKGDRRKKTEA